MKDVKKYVQRKKWHEKLHDFRTNDAQLGFHKSLIPTLFLPHHYKHQDLRM